MNRHQTKKRISVFLRSLGRQPAPAYLILVLVIVAGTSAVFGKNPQSMSPELAFADQSPGGLAIVPASAPSESGYTGAYTGAYESTYTGAYTGAYESTYTGAYTGAYESTYQATTGSYQATTGSYQATTGSYQAAQSYESYETYESYGGGSFESYGGGDNGKGGSGGAAGATASTTLTVRPSLVRSGDTTTVFWLSANVTACTVTENSTMINDSWTGLSGTKTSSPIGEQTIYTLTCTKSGGGTIIKTATVNIIPVFQEQ